ncbi:hypothetical protein [Novacetimonas pomaceti]|uniref:hypothetical protein n=1 Tax=Novacetimonas pomaceti TaxID=2021998 RepID=UPI001EF0D2AC|nr:hypothetical protein [Novacetimonas pomaceti]
MTIIQPLLPHDVAAVAAMRQATSAHKGKKLGPEAGPMFDVLLAATLPADAFRWLAFTITFNDDKSIGHGMTTPAGLKSARPHVL